MKYVVITPVRNEGKHFQRTVDSLTRQTIPPTEWLIVDDGSTDSTPEIIRQASATYAWIRTIQRSDRGFRKNGSGVVEAFNEGLSALATPDWQFICKLDADLEFAPDYFERCFRTFDEEKDLGIVGGDIVHPEGDTLVIESKGDPAFHVRGANKLYSRRCWETIGGLYSLTGWDTLDELKANMLGLTSRRLPDAPVTHLKPTGGADGSWKNAFKNGRGSYICGYHPLFLLARAGRNLVRGRATSAAGLAAGYFSAPFKGVARVDNPALIAFTRREQMRRVLGQPSLWTI